MPIHLLTEAQVEAATDGILHDGHDHGELVLEVRGNGRHKSWFFRYNGRQWDDRRGERIGLGPARIVSLDEARRKANACRNLIKRGVNPKTYREGRQRLADKQAEKQATAERTLGQALDEYFEFAQKERLWKSPNTISTNLSCKTGHLDTAGHRSRPLQHIKVGYVAEILLAIKRKARRGMMVRAHSLLNCMFEWEIGHERYVGINPAGFGRFHPLTKLLGPKPTGRHRPALPFQHLPDVIAHIRAPRRDLNEWLSVAEAAYATGRDPVAIRVAITKHKRFDASDVKKVLLGGGDPQWRVRRAALAKVFRIINEPIALEREDVALYTDIIQVLIFTGARSEMITEMKWGQIKWDEGVIKYLPETDKRESEHKTGSSGDPDNIYTIILTDNVRAILEERKQFRAKDGLSCNADDYVFTHGASRFGAANKWLNEPTNPNTVNTTFKRIVDGLPDIVDKEVTIHGLRAGFGKWFMEVHNAGKDDAIAIADTTLMDAALGHEIKVFRDNKSNKAYVRSPQFKARRLAVMNEWEQFLLSKCPKPEEEEKVTESAEIILYPRPAS